MIETKTTVRVRYAETDQMGIVYHGNYFTWLEVGRIRMLEEIGLPYTEIEASGYKLPVLDARLSYKSPALFDDTVTIICRIKEQPSARLRIHYEVKRDDTLLAIGETVHAFLNSNNRPGRPPEKFAHVLAGYFTQ